MNDRSNASAWGSHIDGASELVRMRGKKQLRTKIGQSLFMTVRAQMVRSCFPSLIPRTKHPRQLIVSRHRNHHY